MYEVFRGDMSPCRIGGEEFVVICGESDREEIEFAARKFREQLQTLEIPTANAKLPKITVSQGIALAEGATKTALDVLKLADKALYAAKADGRDCIRDFAELGEQAAQLAPPLRITG